MTGISRRNLLIAGAGMFAAPTVANAAKARGALPDRRPHIVLVHGAWHGAWAWVRFTPLLTEAGYSFSTLDLSGLGANAHRQAPEIGLHVHGQDILNHLYFNDLRDTAVVAHSYGGAALSQAVAGDKEQRIAHAIYLDAYLPGEGESIAGFQSTEEKATLEIAAAQKQMIPPRAPETWGEFWGLTGENAKWSAPRMRPMSARCFTESVQGDPFNSRIRRTYMRCRQNKNPLFDRFSSIARSDARFAQSDVNGHHNIMLIDPPQMLDSLIAVL